jgi:putative aldouronate transport system substrate-binding protein
VQINAHGASVEHRLTRRHLLGVSAGAVTACLAAGCGGDDHERSGSGPGASVALPRFKPFDGVEADLPASPGRTSDGFLRYPEPVAFADRPPGDGRPVEAMVFTYLAIPPSVDANPYWQEMNRRLDSEVRLSITPQGDYSARWSTTIAGGRLPDMFCVGPTPALPEFMKRNAADLTPYLGGDAILQYPGLAVLAQDQDAWNACIFDGKIMAIPAVEGLTSNSVMYARADILREQGVAGDPTDFASFRDLCKELTDVRRNRWALAAVPMNYLRGMLDLGDRWAAEGGRIVSTLADERFQQMLEAGRELVADGSVNPDASATPISQKKQWFVSGTCALHQDAFVSWFGLYQQNPGVKFEIAGLGIPGFNGGQGSAVASSNVGLAAINAASADRVETMLRIANWFAAPFGTSEYLFQKYGIEGEHYQWSDEHDVVLDPKKVGQLELGTRFLADTTRPLYTPGHADVVRQAHEYQGRVNTKIVRSPTVGLYSETANRKYGSLNAALASLTDDILAGRKPVSAWSDGVKSFMDGGGQKILDEYQQAYERRPK